MVLSKKKTFDLWISVHLLKSSIHWSNLLGQIFVLLMVNLSESLQTVALCTSSVICFGFCFPWQLCSYKSMNHDLRLVPAIKPLNTDSQVSKLVLIWELSPWFITKVVISCTDFWKRGLTQTFIMKEKPEVKADLQPELLPIKERAVENAQQMDVWVAV